MASTLSTNLSIHQTKIELAIVIKKLNDLQNLEKNLRNSINTKPDTEWNMNLENADQLKSDIEAFFQKFSNQTIKNDIKKKLIKRKKKRLRLKIRNKHWQKLKAENLKKRQKLHEKIDDWIKNEKDKNMKKLKIEEQKSQTEYLLSGIMKRKYETLRFIEMLNSLKELRRIRKMTVSKDVKDFHEKDFILKIDQLINVWKDALNEYEIEEKHLRNVLNVKSVENEWNECLFGMYKDDEMIELRAEENVQEFLEIRRAWDSYLVPENSSYGSSIPIGWVMPNENPSEKWAVYKNPNNDNLVASTVTTTSATEQSSE